jgi:hypothetical protein
MTLTLSCASSVANSGSRCALFSPKRINVRFWGQSGHRPKVGECPLLTQSGHWQPEFAVMHNEAHSMVG